MLRVFKIQPLIGIFFSALVGAVFFVSPVVAADKVESNLEKALKSGKKQILFSGKESDDITIKKGVAVIGVSIDKATITGNVKMEDGSSLSNVNVSAKGIVITIVKGANVTLSNVTVRGGEEVGIYATGGGGTLTVKNSRILKNQKGFYILPGKNLNLVGNSISENKEEGLDVRATVSGTIVGNQFTSNGEGGAEIIAGGANLSILKNTFAGNKASGLAIQSYSGNGKAAGNIRLENNTFANNGDYGVNCLSPSGGGGGVAFYRATVKALDNTFRGNKRNSIAGACGIVNRSSLVPDKETEMLVEEEPAPSDKASLREEAVAHFEETVELLHEEEYLLELTLAAYNEVTPWWKRLTKPVVSPEERDAVVEKIAEINGLREAVANFPEEFMDETLKVRKEHTVKRSLERMEALRQYFERLQTPIFRLRKDVK